MCLPTVIAIDGSAASGKSTLGQRLAQRLNYLYFDTGAMYRAVTWACQERHLPADDEAAVSSLAEGLHIQIEPPTVNDGRQYTVLADGQDITWQIRTPRVDAAVAQVSSYPRVRKALIARQRHIGRRGQVIMVGRDIGTVVLPEADLKLFIDASLEERARRRFRECRARGEAVEYETVLAAMKRRDRIDREKPISPMVPAPDAIPINTDGRTVEAVLAQIEALVFARCQVGS
ncbi:MAG: (d)CMP kinase [Anaerolineae bacterium]